MRVKNIGVILETREDAEKVNPYNVYDQYHWREPKEIEAIVQAVKNLGFHTEILGTPRKMGLDLDKFKHRIDFILNLSVGFKERFRIALAPSLFEIAGLPYTGGDPYTKIVCQNKNLMKALLDKLNIPTPPWTHVNFNADVKTLSYPELPVIVKPMYEGSSIGLKPGSVCYQKRHMFEMIHSIRKNLSMPVIVEKFIKGREFKVGFIGNDHIYFKGMLEDVLQDGAPLKEHFLYFNAKTYGYLKKVPRDISLPDYHKILEHCKIIYDMFKPSDYGVFDIRVDEYGQHYFTEFNEDATLHPDRTLTKCCELNGLEFQDMIRLILQSSFERWGIEWS